MADNIWENVNIEDIDVDNISSLKKVMQIRLNIFDKSNQLRILDEDIYKIRELRFTDKENADLFSQEQGLRSQRSEIEKLTDEEAEVLRVCQDNLFIMVPEIFTSAQKEYLYDPYLCFNIKGMDPEMKEALGIDKEKKKYICSASKPPVSLSDLARIRKSILEQTDNSFKSIVSFGDGRPSHKMSDSECRYIYKKNIIEVLESKHATECNRNYNTGYPESACSLEGYTLKKECISESYTLSREEIANMNCEEISNALQGQINKDAYVFELDSVSA